MADGAHGAEFTAPAEPMQPTPAATAEAAQVPVPEDPWQQGQDPWTGFGGGEVPQAGVETGSVSAKGSTLDQHSPRRKGKGKGGKMKMDTSPDPSQQVPTPEIPTQDQMTQPAMSGPTNQFVPPTWSTPQVFGPPSGNGLPTVPPGFPMSSPSGMTSFMSSMTGPSPMGSMMHVPPFHGHVHPGLYAPVHAGPCVSGGGATMDDDAARLCFMVWSSTTTRYDRGSTYALRRIE